MYIMNYVEEREKCINGRGDWISRRASSSGPDYIGIFYGHSRPANLPAA